MIISQEVPLGSRDLHVSLVRQYDLLHTIDIPSNTSTHAPQSDREDLTTEYEGVESRRIAVVLRGVAAASYMHYSGRRITVDWRDRAPSIYKNVIEALGADTFFHAWMGEEDEYRDTDEELVAFFAPTAAEIEPFRKWDWKFGWLIDQENIRCNFCKNFSTAEWNARSYATDVVKYDYHSYRQCGPGFYWTGAKCVEFQGRPLCDPRNRQHFCNAEKLNNIFSFYYSWHRSLS